MSQEDRYGSDTPRMDREARRDDWRREYRTPWGYEDKESDDE